MTLPNFLFRYTSGRNPGLFMCHVCGLEQRSCFYV
nr:MAG TPA: hypothetical protein [Bacteriophage sp.]